MTVSQTEVAARRLWWAGPLTVVASILAVLAARLAAFAVLDLSPEYPPLTPTGLIFFTVVLVSAGVLVFAVVVHKSTTPIRTYHRIALVALLLSFVPDLVLPAFDPATTWTAAIVLMVTHVAAWLPVVLILTNPAIVGRPAARMASSAPTA
jgi:hypothetical protein